MKKLFILLVLLLSSSAMASKPKVVLDSNTAFYEGEIFRYTIQAPRNYRLVIEEAYRDGYSMAFIPKLEEYDSASVMIGVNIYKMRGASLDSLITQDTLAMRAQFGKVLDVREVQPLPVGTGEGARTLYLKSDRQFVPNAELAYFDGGTEVIIFELVITENVLRFKAEQLFSDFVRNFRPMKRGTLGSR